LGYSTVQQYRVLGRLRSEEAQINHLDQVSA
jgi:hypothetical protein